MAWRGWASRARRRNALPASPTARRAATTECASFICANGTCCDTACSGQCAGFPGPEVACGGNGTCHPTTTDRAPFGCAADGIACATGCTTDEECGDGSHCDDGVCLTNTGLGVACGEDTDCTSGLCVNEVCCAERRGECQVCNLPGNEGFRGATNGAECGAGGRCRATSRVWGNRTDDVPSAISDQRSTDRRRQTAGGGPHLEQFVQRLPAGAAGLAAA